MWWSFGSKEERKGRGRSSSGGGGRLWLLGLSSLRWTNEPQQLAACVFVLVSHVRCSGDMQKLVKFSAQKPKKQKEWLVAVWLEGGRGFKKGVNILLPVPMKDTDSNIIRQGPHGGTWVWIANQDGLLWSNPSLSGRPGINVSGETPHCFWLWRLHSTAQPSCPIPTVPSHCEH